MNIGIIATCAAFLGATYQLRSGNRNSFNRFYELESWRKELQLRRASLGATFTEAARRPLLIARQRSGDRSWKISTQQGVGLAQSSCTAHCPVFLESMGCDFKEAVMFDNDDNFGRAGNLITYGSRFKASSINAKFDVTVDLLQERDPCEPRLA